MSTKIAISPLSTHLSDLCHYIHTHLDQSTLQLSPKLSDSPTEVTKLSWLKHVFKVLISSKCNLEQLMTSREETECGQYQQSLQKLELDIRKHIAVEQEMKIHFEEMQERLEVVEGENRKLGGMVEKLRRKEEKDGKEKEKQKEKDKENDRVNKLHKKKQEQTHKITRGRSTTTMVRDKSRARLRQDWEMTENIDLTNHNLVSKLCKKSKNLSKSKTRIR